MLFFVVLLLVGCNIIAFPYDLISGPVAAGHRWQCLHVGRSTVGTFPVPSDSLSQLSMLSYRLTFRCTARREILSEVDRASLTYELNGVIFCISLVQLCCLKWIHCFLFDGACFNCLRTYSASYVGVFWMADCSLEGGVRCFFEEYDLWGKSIMNWDKWFSAWNINPETGLPSHKLYFRLCGRFRT